LRRLLAEPVVGYCVELELSDEMDELGELDELEQLDELDLLTLN
jgi:hypothetical protein